MTDRVLPSVIFKRVTPNFVKEDYPVFTDFMQAYFEYCEQTGQPSDIIAAIRQSRDLGDLDQAIVEEFFDFIGQELLPTIPADVLMDKKLLAKNIRALYAAKGTEKAYRFLFRILYAEDISFYYPKDDILRTSDGKWNVDKSIKTTFSNDNILKIQDKTIRGMTSAATATVSSIVQYENGYIELFLVDIKGVFVANESITTTISVSPQFNFFGPDADDLEKKYITPVEVTVIETILECYGSVLIDNGGASINVGNIFRILDGTSNGNVLGLGTVTKVVSGPVGSVDIDQGGAGYHGQMRQVTNFSHLPINTPIFSEPAPAEMILDDFYALLAANAGTHVDSNGEALIDFPITMLVVTDIADQIIITDALGASGSGAAAVITLVDPNGKILEVVTTSKGQLYQTPRAIVVSATGDGAVLSIPHGGAITKTETNVFPPVSIYPDATVDFSAIGDGTATGSLSTGAVVSVYPGYYLNEDGQLSSSKKLQDNDFYQDYSYQINVRRNLSAWSDLIKRFCHPSGYKVFGQFTSEDFNGDTGATVTGAEITLTS